MTIYAWPLSPAWDTQGPRLIQQMDNAWLEENFYPGSVDGGAFGDFKPLMANSGHFVVKTTRYMYGGSFPRCGR